MIFLIILLLQVVCRTFINARAPGWLFYTSPGPLYESDYAVFLLGGRLFRLGWLGRFNVLAIRWSYVGFGYLFYHQGGESGDIALIYCHQQVTARVVECSAKPAFFIGSAQEFAVRRDNSLVVFFNCRSAGLFL